MRFALVIIMLAYCLNLQSQNVEIGVMLFPNLLSNNVQYEGTSSSLSLNGGGLKLNYSQVFKQSKYNYNAGLEFSFTDWGTQTLSRLGANMSFNNAFGMEIILLNGLALYINKPAYVYGAEANVFYFIQVKDKRRIKLNAGLRFTQNPKYKAIGNYSFVDLLVGISWLFGNPKKAF